MHDAVSWIPNVDPDRREVVRPSETGVLSPDTKTAVPRPQEGVPGVVVVPVDLGLPSLVWNRGGGWGSKDYPVPSEPWGTTRCTATSDTHETIVHPPEGEVRPRSHSPAIPKGR